MMSQKTSDARVRELLEWLKTQKFIARRIRVDDIEIDMAAWPQESEQGGAAKAAAVEEEMTPEERERLLNYSSG